MRRATVMCNSRLHVVCFSIFAFLFCGRCSAADPSNPWPSSVLVFDPTTTNSAIRQAYANNRLLLLLSRRIRRLRRRCTAQHQLSAVQCTCEMLGSGRGLLSHLRRRLPGVLRQRPCPGGLHSGGQGLICKRTASGVLCWAAGGPTGVRGLTVSILLRTNAADITVWPV